MKPCACGCGELFTDEYDKKGFPRKFKPGHNMKVQDIKEKNAWKKIGTGTGRYASS